MEDAGKNLPTRKKSPNKPSDLERALAYAEDCNASATAVSAEYDNYRKRNNAAVSRLTPTGVPTLF